MLNQRTQIEGKLNRLARAYVDGLVDEGSYNVQRKLLQDAFGSLVMPEADATLDAGILLENLGHVWNAASLGERHNLLQVMLEAAYIDLAASRSIVGIRPKSVFYPLFESMENQSGSRITVFHDDRSKGVAANSSTVLVEAGESRTPRPEEAAQNLLQA